MSYVKQQAADKNLGGTLTLGNPFNGGRLNTGIPLPSSLEAGIIGAGKTASRMVQGVRQALPGSNAALDNQVKGEDAAYQPLAQAHPVATTVGETAPYLASALVSPLSSPLAMAGMSATEYGTPTERLERGALAYAGGKAGEGLARVIGGPASRAATPTGAAGDFFDYAGANKWGIPTTVGMNGNKTAQLAESVIANMPFVNGPVNAARNAAYQGFNRAANSMIGDTGSAITPEGLGVARTRIGNVIGDIAGRNNITVDGQLFKTLNDAAVRAQNELTPDEAKIVNGQIQNIWNTAGKFGGDVATLPGTQYKAIQSKMGEIGQARGGTISSIMHDLRAGMRDAMTRSVSPEDSQAWLKANEQYFNLQQIANATKQTPGSLSPAKLLTQVNLAQNASKFGGGNELADLARWAKPTLTDQIPNSGTAQREMMQRLLTNPVTGAAELGGLSYAADHTDHPYAVGTLGLLAPFLTGRALAGKPVSPFTRAMLTRGGGLLGLEAAQ
jgi:hypothetical protein